MTALWQAFDAYLKEKTPSEWERQEVTRYRQRLHDSLDERFGLLAFFQSGSFGNGTGISGRSDVDYIARLPWDSKPGSSATALNTVRDHLRADLWEATSVSVSRPTVTVNFPGVISQYEIAPAYFDSGDGDNTVLWIPGPNGSWLQSAPKAHLQYVRDADRKHNGSVKGLARLLKGWKYENDVPVSSFYLEMRAAQYGHTNDSIWYLGALIQILRTMVNTGLPDMNDPLHLVKRIVSCSSETKRQASIGKARTAIQGLDRARANWLAKNYDDCSRAMRLVLGTDFPYITEGPA